MIGTIDGQIAMQREAVGQIAQNMRQGAQMGGIRTGMDMQMGYTMLACIPDECRGRGQKRKKPGLPLGRRFLQAHDIGNGPDRPQGMAQDVIGG